MRIRQTIALALFWLALPAFASDGVIEINQTSALAGGITPGDAAGFPVTLSRSGSYRLTGSLAADAATSSIIVVTANNVTLDMAGFSVGCPVLPIQACNLNGDEIGIDATDQVGFVLRDGRIIGANGIAVRTGLSARVERIEVRSSGSVGILAGTKSHIESSTVTGSNALGITAETGSRIVNCIVTETTGDGIVISAGVAQGNVSRQNTNRGIITNGASLVVDNVASANGGVGLSSSFDTGYRGNVFNDNNGGEETQVSGAGLDLGGNVCGNDTTCP